MKLFQWTIAITLIAAAAHVAMAQNQAAGNQAPQAPAATVSPGQAAIDKAAAAKKFALVFFWKENDAKTQKAWKEFEAAAAKLTDQADAVSIQITDAAEKNLVDKYSLTRSPMPLALAFAPCGAITKGFSKTFDEKELRTAFVSPCTQLCMKALQDRKLLLVCVVEQNDPKSPVTTPKCAEDFKADAKYGPATEIIIVNANDQAEASLLKDFKVDQVKKPTVVFLAPPGVLIGTFDETSTKENLVAKLVAAQSNPCAGGKCGPGGCK
jgi:hypothetical protein